MTEPNENGMIYLSEWRGATITGFFSPFQYNDQPWLIEMPSAPNCLWLVIFSSVEKLEESCADLGVKNYKIKQITDGQDFVESIISQGVRIMLDPYAVRSENKTRWTEIKSKNKTRWTEIKSKNSV